MPYNISIMKTSTFIRTHVPGSMALQSLIEEYGDGATLRGLGAKYGVCGMTICRALKKGKCTMRKGGNPAAFRGLALQLLVKEYQDGAVIRELADKHSVDSMTIARNLRRGNCIMRIGREPGKPRWGSTIADKISRLKCLYGLTPELLEELWNKQDRQCVICNEPISKEGRGTHIDHDHDTGRVRGLLCSRCNKGIGLLHDDISILQNAIRYLQCNGLSQ